MLDDLPCVISNSCNSSKISISTSCEDLLDMPCCSKIDAHISSMLVETNLVEENNELKAQVSNLKNDLDRSHKGKITLDEILSKQRRLQDKSGLGFTPKKRETRTTRHIN